MRHECNQGSSADRIADPLSGGPSAFSSVGVTRREYRRPDRSRQVCQPGVSGPISDKQWKSHFSCERIAGVEYAGPSGMPERPAGTELVLPLLRGEALDVAESRPVRRAGGGPELRCQRLSTGKTFHGAFQLTGSS